MTADLDSISTGRKIAFSIILFVLPLVLIETTCRVIAYVVNDFNPYYLTYGFKSAGLAMTTHSIPYDGYFKFAPNSTVTQGPRKDIRIPSSINNIGLRGTRNLKIVKKDNVLRVVCLGGSSTFGFHARDDYTYPVLLEKKLNEQNAIPGYEFEVINAGIPSFNTDNLIAIIEKELLAYRPDVVTIYSAYNDAVMILDASTLQSISRWIYDHVATYVALKKILEYTTSIELYSKWKKYKDAPSPEYVDKQIRLHQDRYRKNFERIIELVESSGASLIAIRQPMATWEFLRHDEPRPDYRETVNILRRKLDAGASIDWEEITMLIHSSLVETMAELAAKHQIPVVDNIALVDKRKDRLLSYVHLTEEGNSALAAALAQTILENPDLFRSGLVR